MKIADIRREYILKELHEKHVAADAITQFSIWWDEAINSEISEVNAMTLATVNGEGKPSARVVLLKDYDEKGFVFFTNYNSRKGREIAENSSACLVFFWKELERQIRIDGVVSKISAKESDDYFKSRPSGSQIGAWASPQSQPIESRDWLEHHWQELATQFQGKEVKRPDHWGGYIVKPAAIEFWQGRPGRLHDRILYTIQPNGMWRIERLAP